MMQGHLGHQVLGQLLIAGTGRLGVAGAAVAVASTARQRNDGLTVAIRTAAPALALHALFSRREQLLLVRERELLQRQRAIAERDSKREAQNIFLARLNAQLSSHNTALEREAIQLRRDTADLKDDITGLERHRSLSNDVRDAFVETLSRVRRERKDDRRRCQVEKAILQNKNDSMRKVLAAVTERLRALEAPRARNTGPDPFADPAPPVKKKRATRRQQQRRAKKRSKKREK
jgi:hypothetical protein